jgi:hypothetical protein
MNGYRDHRDRLGRDVRDMSRDEWREYRRRYRRARHIAESRTDLSLELMKFVLVTLLLLVFVRPIGVIVAIVWGLKLLRRYSHAYGHTELRRRWIDRELRRDRPEWDPDYRAALEELDAV